MSEAPPPLQSLLTHNSSHFTVRITNVAYPENPAHWKKSHWDFYTRELSQFGAKPTESMIVVFEEFELLYKK